MTSSFASPAVVVAVESVVRSLAMAAVVWIAIRLFRLRNVPAQKLAWTLVLALSCAMPGLLLLESAHPDAVPAVKFAAASRLLSSLDTQYDRFALRAHSLRSVVEAVSTAPAAQARPSMPAQADAQPAAGSVAPALASQDENVTDTATYSAQAQDDTPEVLLTAEPARPTTRWHLASLARFLVPAYLAVSAVLLLRVLFGLVLAARLWRQAEPVSVILDPRATVRISQSIESPVTIGSGIVLPTSAESWDRRRLRMILAHERAHVRQGDFYLQLAASLYAALTWISPLGWLLKRELAELGEAISDRAALDEDSAVSSTDYAELLLEFAAMPRRGFERATAGVGMARPSSVQGRIERILNPRAFAAAFTGGRTTTLATAILVPCALLMAVSVRRAHAAEAQQAFTLTATPAPAPLPAITITAEPQPAPQLTMTIPAAKPLPSPAPKALSMTTLPGPVPMDGPSVIALTTQPAPLTSLTLSLQNAAASGSSSGEGSSQSISTGTSQSASSGESHSYSIDSDNEDDEEHGHNGHHSTGVIQLNGPNNSFAIVRGDAKVHGEGSEGSAFEKARKQANGDMVWFERDGKSYIITDPATVDAAVRQWRASRTFIFDNDADRAMFKFDGHAFSNMKPMTLQLKTTTVSTADIQKQLAEAQKSLAKLQAEYPDGKDNVLTAEQVAELRREVNEAVRNLTQIDGNVSRQIRIEVNEQMQKQMEANRDAMNKAREESRAAMDKARESMREAQRQAQTRASEQMQSFFDQALKDGKARPVQ